MAAAALPLSHLIPIGRQHFAFAEQQWLWDNKMAEYLRLDEDSQADVTIFKDTMYDQFTRVFPWRLGVNRDNETWPEQLRAETGWDIEAACFSRDRMMTWLRKNHPDPVRRRRPSEWFSQKPPPDPTQYLSIHYKPMERDLREERETLSLLLNESRECWSSLDCVHLRHRRQDLVAHVDHVMRAISRYLGVEMVTIGVYAEDEKIKYFDVATSRARPFLKENACTSVADAFMMWAGMTIGPNLNVNIHTPTSTVIGDLQNNLRPIFPQRPLPEPQLRRQLDIWQNAFWKYSGGQGDVPYQLLEVDSKSQEFALTHRRNYPVGVYFYESPLVMSFNHLVAWRDHVLQAQKGELEIGAQFHFLQPRPGIYASGPPVDIHPDCKRISYPAECLLYARWLHRLHTSRRELPCAYPGTNYKSIPKKEEKRILGMLPHGEGKNVSLLLSLLSRHDGEFPDCPSQDSWGLFQKSLPLLPKQPPGYSNGLDYFLCDTNLHVPAIFFEAPRDKQEWCLYNFLNFMDYRQWLIQPSGTLKGGPWGIKWPALVAIVLKISIARLRAVDGVKPDWFHRRNVHVSGSLEREIDMCIERIVGAISRSIDRLRTLQPHRHNLPEPEGPEWLRDFGPNSWDRVELSGPPEWLTEWEEQDITPKAAEVGMIIPDPTGSDAETKNQAEASSQGPGNENKTAGTAVKRAAEGGTSPPKKNQRRQATKEPMHHSTHERQDVTLDGATIVDSRPRTRSQTKR